MRFIFSLLHAGVSRAFVFGFFLAPVLVRAPPQSFCLPVLQETVKYSVVITRLMAIFVFSGLALSQFSNFVSLTFFFSFLVSANIFFAFFHVAASNVYFSHSFTLQQSRFLPWTSGILQKAAVSAVAQHFQFGKILGCLLFETTEQHSPLV